MRKSPLVSQRMLVLGLAGKAGGDAAGIRRALPAAARLPGGRDTCVVLGGEVSGEVQCWELGHTGLSSAFTAHGQLGRLFPISLSHSFLYF